MSILLGKLALPSLGEVSRCSRGTPVPTLDANTAERELFASLYFAGRPSFIDRTEREEMMLVVSPTDALL
jgi:hypothetical protein